MRSVAVIGGSLSGLHAVRALRDQGYDGRITVIGEETHLPYDRPPLSKRFLTEEKEPAPEGLLEPEDEDTLDVEWILGERAAHLDPRAREVTLTGGRPVRADGFVLATGAAARTLPGSTGRPPRGVHTLRTLDDAVALRADLHAGPRRVVVIGAGFIGAEVASSCRGLGHDVTVVEAAAMPLLPQLGAEMAAALAALHGLRGTRLLCGAGVVALRGATRVESVELSDGRTLPAEVVVVGIGVTPRTDWLAGSGLAVDDGVLCDAGCVTGAPHVVAVGDVARVHRPELDAHVRAEHWTSAVEQPAVAVRNLLAGRTVDTYTGRPYFWSDQYGVRVQFAGRRAPTDTVRVLEGEPARGDFLAVYERDGRTTAVLSVNRPRPFTRLRRELARA
ncbi:NAD(P)/FAD-dependent oxidoreductase [Streptomyces sp. NPDC087851]|uniref:NAD(P)/FAD-dependent oxidoreductase n=1 Tax=Streptomyces sp. NPDC087851 TaxID=3365810 RepID=UPI0037F5652A